MKHISLMFAIVVLALCLYPQPAEAVNLMVLGKYDATDQGMGFQVDVMGDLSKHFFITGGIGAGTKSLNGGEALMGFRLFGPKAKYNFGAVGGIAAQIYSLVYEEEAVDKTYGKGAAGVFASIIFDEKVTGFAAVGYTDPLKNDVAAEPQLTFGVGVVLSLDFTEK